MLFDRDNVEVGSVNGSGLLNGKLKVSKAKLWWPIDMSEQPGYMYTLMVSYCLIGILRAYYFHVRDAMWDRLKGLVSIYISPLL